MAGSVNDHSKETYAAASKARILKNSSEDSCAFELARLAVFFPVFFEGEGIGDVRFAMLVLVYRVMSRISGIFTAASILRSPSPFPLEAPEFDVPERICLKRFSWIVRTGGRVFIDICLLASCDTEHREQVYVFVSSFSADVKRSRHSCSVVLLFLVSISRLVDQHLKLIQKSYLRSRNSSVATFIPPHAWQTTRLSSKPAKT